MLSTKDIAAQVMNKDLIATVCAIAQWGHAPVGQKEVHFRRTIVADLSQAEAKEFWRQKQLTLVGLICYNA